MRKLWKLLGVFNLLLFLSGCLSIGSGPLSDSISVQSGQTKIKYKLPNGFCLDRSANTSSALQQTLVVTNCIAVNTVDQPYYSRRPVDTIVNITFTQSRVPKKISQKNYLSVIAKNIEFKKTLSASSNRKFINGEKKLHEKFYYESFQRVISSKRREYVRKYFFIVDKKVAVMTILSLQKPRRSTYSLFESFIKKIS
mgnify:FL=1